MKRNLRIVSLVFALISVSAWVFLGANRGWTRTSVATRTVDEVTGIEGIQYQKRFIPGVDLLGGALMLAGLTACASLFLTHQPKKQITQ
jgi:hypothetical protein